MHIDMDLYYVIVELKKKNPVEYNLKMAQFRSLEEQKKSAKLNNISHCPHCKSTNLKKIGTLGRTASISFFGLVNKKISKQWHCNNCGSDF